jgi:hypothetical protein
MIDARVGERGEPLKYCLRTAYEVRRDHERRVALRRVM